MASLIIIMGLFEKRAVFGLGNRVGQPNGTIWSGNCYTDGTVTNCVEK